MVFLLPAAWVLTNAKWRGEDSIKDDQPFPAFSTATEQPCHLAESADISAQVDLLSQTFTPDPSAHHDNRKR